MRDPLARIPIRYKLPLGFLAVCLVAFGLGGIMLIREARGALEEEIDRRLHERGTAMGLLVDRHLDMVRRRAEDFASDGLIRGDLARINTSDTSAGPLRRHLADNKLSLVEAFVGAALYDERGEARVTVPDQAQGDATLAQTEDTAIGALRPARTAHPFPTFCVATPLYANTGATRIGTLQLVVRADIWARSVDGLDAMPDMPLRWVRLSGQDVALVVSKGVPPDPTADASHRQALSQSGWAIEFDVDRAAMMAPVDRLRVQYALIGLGLLLATAAVLFFPLRFMLRPLTKVSEAARKMAKGDIAARVEHDAEDEIGDLASAFNIMATAVADRTQRLEQAAASLRGREQEVRIERDRLGAVIHSMEDGLFILDAQGRVTLANAAARPLVGALDEQAMERLECAHESRPIAGCLACLADLDSGQQECVIEHDGRIYDIHTTALPAAPGAHGGRLCVSRDVTERIGHQESQAHQERMAVLGEVAAVMAHELNNPLAAISMFSEMLEEQLEETSKLREGAAVIKRNVAACKRTIHGLLDLAARGRLEIAPFDVRALLDEVVDLLRPIHQRARVAVHVAEHDGNCALVGDEVRLRQVFINLLMNAIQACSGGGRIDLGIADREDHVEIDVADDGAGISDDLRDRIFEPFFTTKGAGVGTGLGLPTSRRIVEEHGGTLVCIDADVGSTFRVRLPRKASRRAWEAQARLEAEVGL